MYVGFQAIAQGEMHKEKGLPCQDAVRRTVSFDSKVGIAVVADGHGSEKHFRSDVGSSTAVDVAEKAIKEFLKILTKEKGSYRNQSRMDGQLQKLEGAIITRWRQGVRAHFDAHPLNDTETHICEEQHIDPADENNRVRMYGTTLIAAMIQKTMWFAIQIGDGKCAILDAAGVPQFPPALEDESLAGGKTTSLCDSNALGNFRHAFDFCTIRGITAASDGVTDSFIPDKYLELHRRLYRDFTTNPQNAETELQKSIAVWSSKGSRDDASMAGIFLKDKKGVL
jgi:serine/threonine protein phosphatase PrpC